MVTPTQRVVLSLRRLWRTGWRMVILALALKLLLIVLLKSGLGGKSAIQGLDMHMPQTQVEQKMFAPARADRPEPSAGDKKAQKNSATPITVSLYLCCKENP